jgi:6-pyruvoyltetrahydropterin/6-carboxytetrahydropterin synthase
MITTISKSFDFDAAHHLPNMPEGHKCRRVHGHTYRVEVRIRAAQLLNGCVLDYGELARAWQPMHDLLDHHDLNEIRNGDLSLNVLAAVSRVRTNPTTEELARLIAVHFGEWCANNNSVRVDLHSICVHESSTTWAEVLW